MIKGTCRCGAITIELPRTPAYMIDCNCSILRCRACGCVTHWKPLKPGDDGRMGVNMANFEPGVVAALEVRRFDGADTWEYL